MFSPEAQEHTQQHSETLQNSTEGHDPISISIGKADAAGDLSISIGNQELTLSLYQTPDLTERDARHVCEMFAEELAESVTESKYVELPPLRFMRETARSSNINMEALIIDVDQAGLEEYESLRLALENVDDLKTEADIDEVSLAEWIEEPVNVREYEALTCEEIFELDDDRNEIIQILTESEKLQQLSESNLRNKQVYSASADVTSTSLGKDENSVSQDLISDSLTKKQNEIKEKAADVKQKSTQKPASHITCNQGISKKEDNITDEKSLKEKALLNENDENQQVIFEKKNEDIKSELDNIDLAVSQTLTVSDESKAKNNNLSSKYNIHEYFDTASIPEPIPTSLATEVEEILVGDDDLSSVKSKAQNIVGEKNNIGEEKDRNALAIVKKQEPDELKPEIIQENTTLASTIKLEEPFNITLEEVESGDTIPTIPEDTKSRDGFAKSWKKTKLEEPGIMNSGGKVSFPSLKSMDSKDEEIKMSKQMVLIPEKEKFEKPSMPIRKEKETEKLMSKTVKGIKPEELMASRSGEEKSKEPGTTTEAGSKTKELTQEMKIVSTGLIQNENDAILKEETVKLNLEDKNNQGSTQNDLPNVEGALTQKQKEIREKALASKKKFSANKDFESEVKSETEILGNKKNEPELMPDTLQTDSKMEECSKDSSETAENKNKTPVKRSALEVLALDILEIHKPIFEMTQIPEFSGEIVEQPKNVTRQTSAVDSESLPDIETFNKDDFELRDQAELESKDVLDEEDFEFDEEAFRRNRRASSYEDTIANMDPDILKELGITPGNATNDEQPTELFDLDQLPVETTLQRLSRIEEKALQIALEDDIVPRKSRSRSRSRSKSRPPGLDTVIEKSKEEKAEAKYYAEKGFMALPSLDTIKESPSTASVAGLLYGGFSSTSVNTVLQGSQSSASVHQFP